MVMHLDRLIDSMYDPDTCHGRNIFHMPFINLRVDLAQTTKRSILIDRQFAVDFFSRTIKRVNQDLSWDAGSSSTRQ